MPFDTSHLQAAIVDLDGTMVDTLGDFMVALTRMLDDLALPHAERAFVERTIGKGSEHLLRSTLQHAAGEPPSQAMFEHAWQRYQQHYLAINGQHADVFPGVAEGLERLREAGLKLACLTNKPLSFAQPLLAAKGLAGHFTFVFGGDSFERKKPDPLPLIKTCQALGTPPARTLMLGDSANDAQAARAAGCPVMLVTYGYNHGEPVRAVDADGFLDRIDQIALAPR